MQRVLKRADEDAAAVVVGDLALFDERHGCHQRLNGTAIVTYTFSQQCHCQSHTTYGYGHQTAGGQTGTSLALGGSRWVSDFPG